MHIHSRTQPAALKLRFLFGIFNMQGFSIGLARVSNFLLRQPFGAELTLKHSTHKAVLCSVVGSTLTGLKTWEINGRERLAAWQI